jgi:hypothetical protein
MFLMRNRMSSCSPVRAVARAGTGITDISLSVQAPVCGAGPVVAAAVGDVAAGPVVGAEPVSGVNRVTVEVGSMSGDVVAGF